MSTEISSLCKWAEGLARAEAVLPEPISYDESPLRHITTARVGEMGRSYLVGIRMAQNWKGNSAGWYSDAYWDNMLEESVRELTAMRDAIFAAATRPRREPAVGRPTTMQMQLGEEGS